MTSTRLVVLCLLVLTGLRLAYVGRVELSPDEAYYQMWSERLDWGYYSKGPGVAAIIRAGTMLFGVNEFGVRCFSPVFALGTSFVLFFLARRLYGEGAAAWLTLMLNVTPLFTAGSLLMTIDTPSVFCWASAMAACCRALAPRGGGAQGWWLAAGVSIGLGFLCKYTNAMELLSIVWALLMVRRWRGEFRRPGFYLMLLVAAIIGSPPVFWNAHHAWITLSHLGSRGRLGTAFDRPLGEFSKFFTTHLAVYSPLVLLGLLVAVGWGWRRSGLRVFFWRRPPGNAPRSPDPDGEKARFLLAFGLPLVGMYTLLGFKTAGEPNWTAPGFLSLSVLAAALWYERARARRWAAVYAAVALVVGLAASIAVLDTDLARDVGVRWNYHHDPTARLLGWRTTAQAMEAFRNDEERQLGAPVFLIANRYQLAAELDFYLADKRRATPADPAVYMPESQSLDTQFSFWPRYDQIPAANVLARQPGAKPPRNAEEEFRGLEPSPFVGRSALFVTDEDKLRNLPGTVEDGFEQCALVAQYEVRRRGQPLRTLRVYACFNYKGLEL